MAVFAAREICGLKRHLARMAAPKQQGFGQVMKSAEQGSAGRQNVIATAGKSGAVEGSELGQDTPFKRKTRAQLPWAPTDLAQLA